MNNTLLLVRGLLFAAMLVTTSAARPSRDDQVSNHARIVTDELVPLPGIRRIKLGMTREQVLSSMRGKPDEIPNSETWIYWSFQGNRRPDNNGAARDARVLHG
jgi:hypothetical protein